MDLDQNLDVELDQNFDLRAARARSRSFDDKMKLAGNIEFSKDDSDELLFVKGLQQLNSSGLVDIGNLAAWEVSSAKSLLNMMGMLIHLIVKLLLP